MNQYIATVVTAIGKLSHYSEFIDRYYKNLKEQTIFNQLEVIIVYMEWSAEFDKWKESENIKFILDGEGRGMYNAWNIGIRNSTTKYVTNWNIDDLRFPTNIESKVMILENNSDIDLVYNWYVVSSYINENFNNFDTTYDRYINCYPDNAHEYVYQCCMCGPDPLWRTEIHSNIGYFDTQYPSIADWEMWIRMAANGYKFKIIPEVLCIFFESKNSVSNLMSESREKVEKKNLYNQYKNGFSNPKVSNWYRNKIASSIKLSILIPSLNRRSHYLDRLLQILNPQIEKYKGEVEIVINTDNGEKSIGTKRNELLERSLGQYIAFVDDDDIVEPYYVEEVLGAIKSNPDVVGIHLLHKEDGVLKGLTYHSLKYDKWWQETNKDNPTLMNYYRNPNHLNPIKREYATQIGFPHINIGEDRDYSYRILPYLKSEVYIDKPIYHYMVRTKKEC